MTGRPPSAGAFPAERPAARSRLRAAGLGTRLLVAIVLVVATGAATAWLVATAVAPSLFHAHMMQAGLMSPEASAHAEQAFRSANGISLAVSLAAALVASVAVSLYVTGRIGRSLAPLSRAAAELAAGRYEVRAPAPGLGTEFDGLAAAMNELAGRLQRVDSSRRRLLGDLAHELRTPVATLDAYLEGIEDGVARLDADTVAVLRAQTARLARLAEDVSAVSHAEEHAFSLHPARHQVADLVAAAQGQAAAGYAAKGVGLRADVAAGLPPVDVDADRIAQVLGNLLDNALRHTPSGGQVTVRADGAADGVRIRVTDSGDGIPAEHVAHVFERFYRVDAARDRAHGGSGIGLAIVKALVEAHGGRVEAASPGPGAGSTFTVRLPAAH